MRLAEALTILRATVPTGASEFRVALACGFTPLHLETFIGAHLRLALPSRRIAFEGGLYGNLLGNIERLGRTDCDATALILEWADLDPRLGLRSLGGWSESAASDILANSEQRLTHIAGAIEKAPWRGPVAISLPTLPLPPLLPTTASPQASLVDLKLRELVNAFAVRMTGLPYARVSSAAWLDARSPSADCFDPGAELLSGFPYTTAHAAALAEAVAALIQSPAPRKGIITDLDDTLWKGLVGEIGVADVSWSLDHHSHMHGVYQSLLKSLAEIGVLIGVASKNDPAVVEEAFQREDLIVPKDSIFPMEVHWHAKSASVGRILDAWNVGPESVVFVDDSPAELAEVKAAHPAVECIRFPGLPKEVYALVTRLRDLFAKPQVTEEDRIRVNSLRTSRLVRVQSGGGQDASDAFHQQANSVVTFKSGVAALDARTVELLNKTNQFNLNGIRYTEAELRRLLDADGFVIRTNYADKYGPLGTIAVVLGHTAGRTLAINGWVMSCRAFSRRIEHACLDHLFRRYDVDAIEFDFAVTARNQPLRDFFAEFLGEAPESPFALRRGVFYERCVPLFHQIEEEVFG